MANVSSTSSKAVDEELHVKRFYSDEKAPPVLMVHGAVENGKIYYSDSGKGLGPYLAKNGYDVFIVDLRGRGLSRPPISKHSKYGLTEILKEDFAAYINKVKEIKGDVPQHWIAHSWGGVLMLAFLARNFKSVKIASMVFFATKRRISIMSLQKLWKINFMWGFMARLIIGIKGYVPAKEYKAGSDNESKRTHLETNYWIRKKKWLDWHDQFDYAKSLQNLKLPPTLHLVGKNDSLLGHPTDVKLLMHEVGDQNHEIMILGKSKGNINDYGHIDILTHKDTPTDVYPIALGFMKKNS